MSSFSFPKPKNVDPPTESDSNQTTDEVASIVSDDEEIGLLENAISVEADRERKRFLKDLFLFITTFQEKFIMKAILEGGEILTTFIDKIDNYKEEIDALEEEQLVGRSAKALKATLRLFKLIKTVLKSTCKLPGAGSRLASIFKQKFVIKVLGSDECFLINESLKALKDETKTKAFFKSSAFQMYRWQHRPSQPQSSSKSSGGKVQNGKRKHDDREQGSGKYQRGYGDRR